MSLVYSSKSQHGLQRTTSSYRELCSIERNVCPSMVVIGEYHPDMANQSSPDNFEESYYPDGRFLVGIQLADIPFFC